ncbi:hypothetical protein CKM354_001235900 [Cercospora kikuchii]|uniref:Glycosyl transferase 64 domain-containing protein n=1 Tax=Cercospora kikuchii TaxID=84275 RepID=A0A9P3FLU3_9PEZI|nr:uncharacterized protein CKM354_001235900 [Cercospora kikuchii]GIZ49327.1 hypothetical protein CKM354_001235900 [Cercospora kikuchii]
MPISTIWERRALLFACPLALLTLLLLAGWLRHDPSAIRHPLQVLGLSHEGDGLEGVLGKEKPAEEDGFTIVSPTYRRLETLPQFLDNYANGNLSSLRKIVLLWNDIENDPPPSFLGTLDTYRVPVVLEQRHINSLNQRFHPTEHVKTNCVFSVDDDMIFKPEDVEYGYQAWKDQNKGRQRMLGFIAREVRRKGQQVIYDQPHKEYHMVLTKAAFYHTDWMKGYWANDAVMKSLREYVEEHDNCEDIFMSFLHAHHTRTPPIFVKPEIKIDFGGNDGISSRKGHLQRRAACVKRFNEAFGDDTLVPTDTILERVRPDLWDQWG